MALGLSLALFLVPGIAQSTGVAPAFVEQVDPVGEADAIDCIEGNPECEIFCAAYETATEGKCE